MKRLLPLAAAALLVAALLVLLAIRVLGGSPEAHVVFEGNVPVLVVRLPSADDADTVTVLGRAVPVRDGEVRVDIAPSSLFLGPNDIVVSHDGDELRLPVELRHIVHRDEEALSSDPPRLGIVVRARPGTALSVDGRSVALDAQGQARVAVEATSDGRLAEHTFRIQFSDGADASSETLRISARPATFDLRQPPAVFVTDRSSLTLDARVAPLARVVFDGSPLANEAGRVRSNLALPREGEFRFRLDVIEEGALRRTQVFALRRAADLATAATAYEVDRSVTYDSLSARADAERGKRVELGGRVFHLRVEGGRSVLQLLVQPCAAADGCPLWVEYPAATTARVGDAVRVRGVADGVQTYRDEGGGAQHDAPRVVAAFVASDVP